jgi:hypothetical protein
MARKGRERKRLARAYRRTEQIASKALDYLN